MTKRFALIILIPLAAACSTLTLKPVSFEWPIEDVMNINENGTAKVERYSLELNTKQIFFAEFNDSTNFGDKKLRIIRDYQGFYFLTGSNFKNVYVFAGDISALKLEEKIEVSKEGLKSPVFNQKNPVIELIDGQNKLLLNNKGIVR